MVAAGAGRSVALVGVVIELPTRDRSQAPPGSRANRGRATSVPEIDVALGAVAAGRTRWRHLSVASRLALLDRVIADTAEVAGHWVAVECERKQLAWGSQPAGEEWSLGPWSALRGARMLRRTLAQILEHGRPQLPFAVERLPSGQAVVPVQPAGLHDRLFDPRLTAEVRMAPGVDPEQVLRTVGGPYRADAHHHARVGAILGSGDVSSVAYLDVLHKLFAEDQVVVLKLSPALRRLSPVLATALGALIDAGYVRIVHGGDAAALVLAHHPQVEALHISGFTHTHDAIVWGTGAGVSERKAANRPLLEKPVSSQLGSVTPAIVVPGGWSRGELDLQALRIAEMFAHGGSYECGATRVLITDPAWSGREELLAGLRRVLGRTPNRFAHHPLARERFERFEQAHPERELLGHGLPGSLPWALIAGVDPAAADIVFRADPFAPVLSETALPARSAADFIDRAVEFCNDRLWGTLGMSLIVSDRSRTDPAVAAALSRALRDLRYGTIVINGPVRLGFSAAATPWGAFPAVRPDQIQSGAGFVHNSFMFTAPEKTVIRLPFESRPAPPWLATRRHHFELARRLTEFEAGPRARRLGPILWHWMRR